MLDHPMAQNLLSLSLSLSLSLVCPFIFKRNSPRIFQKAQVPISALEDSSQSTIRNQIGGNNHGP
jgi:hypothetical protein